MPVSKILGRKSFDLARLTALSPELLEEGHHAHHPSGVGPVSVTARRPVDIEKFKAWLATFVNAKGADLYRCKGVLALPGASQRFVFQGVHMTVENGLGHALARH